MSAVQRLVGWLDDALNPIVVKEMRQAARGRFLVSLLMFYLAAQLLALGGFLLSTGVDRLDSAFGREYGSEAFALLLGVLLFVLLVCLPIYAAVRFAVERTGEGLALLFISTLSPRRLVLGKLASNVLVGALILAAGAPYLFFTFFLRGIDLTTMTSALVAAGLGMLTLVAFAILVAALPAERLLRWLVYLASLGFVFWFFFFALFVLVESATSGVGLVGLGGGHSWAAVLAVLMVVGLMFELTVAMVAPPASDRARPVRRYLLVFWLLSLVLVVLTPTRFDAVELWLQGWTWVVVGSLLVAVSSRDRPSRRVLAQLPRRGPRRGLALLLTSGSWPGLLFGVVLLVATVSAGQLLAWDRADGGLELLVRSQMGLGAQALAYALLGLEIHRRWLANRLPAGSTWLVSLGAVALLSLLPIFVGLYFMEGELDVRAPQIALLFLFNPVSFGDLVLAQSAVVFALGWAVIMVAIVWRRLRGLAQGYRPRTEVPTGPGEEPAVAESV